MISGSPIADKIFGGVYKNKRVFVTGHNGFKGTWLCMWLTMLGAEVTGYSFEPAAQGSHFDLLGLQNNVRHMEGDIRDLETLTRAVSETRPDFVFHLGAQALVREAYRDPKATFDINVCGSVNVLESCRHCDSVKALVYVSSDKCYRNVEWEWGYRENDFLGGNDPYSASKGCAEIVFASYNASFLMKDNRLHAASARSGNVIGGGDWAKDRIVPDSIRALTSGKPIVIRNPNSTRPWQHVLEPLGGYLLLGGKLYADTAKKFCSAWNFGPDRTSNKTVKELVSDIIGIWGSGELAVQQDPNAPHEDTWLQLNCDKAYHWLKWRPTWHYPDSVNQTILWYKAFSEGRNMRDFTSSQIEAYMERWRDLGHD
jgi:CDP-glucose 4,6-dehydratase